MPKLKKKKKTVEVPVGKRLAQAIEDAGVNIGHRCGGYAKCTTCRVEFVEGEPDVMTKAEYERLTNRDLFGEVRLSCQIECDRDMSVKPLITLENEPSWQDTGPELEETVTPEAEWFPIDMLTDE